MYEVKVLSNEEFDSLPYPDMESSLGVADPKTGTAYVRYTGVGEVDKYLINHELEHLIEGHGGEHSNHYRNGVYYKGIGEFFQSSIPGTKAFKKNALPILSSLIPGGDAILGSLTRPKQQEAPQGAPNVMQSQESPMNSFKPASPNVVSPGGMSSGGSGGRNAIGAMQGGGSPIERVRGFFSSRNPQGAF